MSIHIPGEQPSNWHAPVNPAWFGPLYWGSENPYAIGVQRLLFDDRVEAALDIAEKLGVGSYGEYLPRLNLLKAEKEARVRGERLEIDKSLSVEFISEEQSGRAKEIGDFSANIMGQERDRFSWSGGAKVLLTLLPRDFDAPWATAPYGYCSERKDYFKIAIPFHATVAPPGFARVLAHEYAHVISLSESKSRIPEWVGEGFSVFASNDFDPRSRSAFLQQRDFWLGPQDLQSLFGPRVDLGSQAKWFAYQQSGWLVRYLASLKGEKMLVRYFAEYADESFFKNLKIMTLSETRTAEALHTVYKTTEEEVFTRAYESMANLRTI